MAISEALCWEVLREPILSAEPRQLLALGGGKARLPLGAISAGAIHPLAQRRLGQIEIAVDAAHALALVEHQPDSLGFEVVIESPARPALGYVCYRSGHRIPHGKDVHETGSSRELRRRTSHNARGRGSGLTRSTRSKRLMSGLPSDACVEHARATKTWTGPSGGLTPRRPKHPQSKYTSVPPRTSPAGVITSL